MSGPSHELIRSAWDAAQLAEQTAAEAKQRVESLLLDAYMAGASVRELCDATGIGYSRANERKMYRRLQRPFRELHPS